MQILNQVLVITSLAIFVDATYGCTVLTGSGAVRGTNKKISKTDTMYMYLGIPYAKPPLGELRFQPPQPLAKWESVWDATAQKPQCVQSRSTLVRTDKIEGSEDCLYLNVYTPQPSTTKNDMTYPVMVWLHGGGFYEGDNSYELYPPDNFVEEGIIVVTVAYRLGVFGFLSTGDLVCPGNNGIKDQIMALKWVKENIANFGGNNNDITIWGESAGGISVSFLMLSPLASGLYNKAIVQSGASILAVSVGVDQPKIAFKTGEYLGIDTSNTEELITNLRKVDYKDLQAAASKAGINVTLEKPLEVYPFASVVEPEHPDAVIATSPYVLLETEGAHLTPVLMGFNSNEGNGLPDAIARSVLTTLQLNPATLVPGGLHLKTQEEAYKIGSIIKERYFENDSTAFSEKNFVHWYGDMHIIRPIIQQGQLLSTHTDVYFYRFNCIGLLGNPIRTNWDGVGHAEELNFLFPRLSQPKILSHEDMLCRQRLVRMWSNFAKYGNPTVASDLLLENIVWPKTAPVPEMTYLNIENKLTIEKNPDELDFKFWTNIFETYGYKPFTVY